MNNLNIASKQELIEKIIQKKEFSRLAKKDVELAFEKFDKGIYLDIEKIKLTRDLLRKAFSGFTSQKILKIRNKSSDWILKKHLSTKERMPYYKEVYGRILKGIGAPLGVCPKGHKPQPEELGGKVSIIDLGAGVNGFSYNHFLDFNVDINYFGVESVGQLVDLMNYYFKNEKIKGKVFHLSLFELENIKDLIKQTKKPKIIFLFKTLDSLEMLKKDYSKKLLQEITPLAERVAISFATKSMRKRTKFKVDRSWIHNFIQENFIIIDDFEIGGERYIVFNN